MKKTKIKAKAKVKVESKSKFKTKNNKRISNIDPVKALYRNVIMIVVISLGIICTMSFIIIKTNKINKKLAKEELKIQNKYKTNEKIKKDYEEIVSNIENLRALNRRINDVSKGSFKYEKINDFKEKFEKEKMSYNIDKISYNNDDDNNETKIIVPFSGEYKNLKEFLYNVERKFYFLSIDSMKITKDKSSVKAKINFRAYFIGDDTDEE